MGGQAAVFKARVKLVASLFLQVSDGQALVFIRRAGEAVGVKGRDGGEFGMRRQQLPLGKGLHQAAFAGLKGIGHLPKPVIRHDQQAPTPWTGVSGRWSGRRPAGEKIRQPQGDRGGLNRRRPIGVTTDLVIVDGDDLQVFV